MNRSTIVHRVVLGACVAASIGTGAPCAAAGVAVAEASAAEDSAPLMPFPNGDPAHPVWIRMGRINVIPLEALGPRQRAEIAEELARNGPAEVSDNDGLWVEPLPPLVAEVGQGTAGRLAFTPLRLDGLVLDGLRPLGAGQFVDAHQGEPILSAIRYWRRPDGIALSLMENALTSHSAVIIVRELQNATVGKHPAQLLVQRSPRGRMRSVVLWSSPRASYTLTVDDDVDHPAQPRWNREWLLGIARQIAARDR